MYDYKNVHIHGRDEFLTSVDQGCGALLFVSHLGNHEVCRALIEESKRIQLNVLVHTKHAENFNRLLNETDKTNFLNLIQVTEINPAVAMMLQDKLQQGEVLVIAADRTPVGGGRQSMVSFLGDPAYFPQGPYILASVLQCPTYLMFCVKSSESYQMFFEKFADSIKLSRKHRERDLKQWVQRYADRLSNYVLQYPLQWGNFYDFWHTDENYIKG